MDKLQSLIQAAQRIVVFTGAGFSTESGIPDFRSTNSKRQKIKYKDPVEVMLSHTFFLEETKAFYDFYRNEMLCLSAQPNKAHRALANLEKMGKLEAVITQNIDGLHTLAGNQKVIELHGSVHRNYCTKCHQFYDANTIVKAKGIPTCTCGGILKPDVVLYEEALDSTAMNKAINALQRADLLIVAGTSLVVYPAAGLLRYYDGKDMVLINRDATSADASATLVFRENIVDVLDFINTL